MSAVQTFKDNIDAKIKIWLELGIWYEEDRVPRGIQKAATGKFVRMPTTLTEDRAIRQLAKKAASELKRPMVHAFKNLDIDYVKDGGVVLASYVTLHLPLTKRMAPIQAWMELGSTTYKDINGRGGFREQARAAGIQCVKYNVVGRVRRFEFHSMEFFNQFLRRCREDESFRKALDTQ